MPNSLLLTRSELPVVKHLSSAGSSLFNRVKHQEAGDGKEWCENIRYIHSHCSWDSLSMRTPSVNKKITQFSPSRAVPICRPHNNDNRTPTRCGGNTRPSPTRGEALHALYAALAISPSRPTPTCPYCQQELGLARFRRLCWRLSDKWSPWFECPLATVSPSRSFLPWGLLTEHGSTAAATTTVFRWSSRRPRRSGKWNPSVECSRAPATPFPASLAPLAHSSFVRST